MKDFVKKLMALEKPPVQEVMVIKKPLPGGRYEVVDSQGRPKEATATASWRAGESVIVSGGRIIGAAGRITAPKIYEV